MQETNRFNVSAQTRQAFDPSLPPPWLAPAASSWEIRIPARLLWGILLSLLIHALLLFGFLLEVFPPQEVSAPPPLSVVLNLKQPKPPAAPVVTPPQPPSPPPPKPAKKIPPAPKQVLKTDQASALKLPMPKALPTPPSQPEPATAKPPVEDFASMIKRRQNDRFSNEMLAKQINEEAAAAERGPSEEERRMKNMLNNLKFGTNGLFTIKRMDPFNASFSFKGWTTDYASANTQYYEVEAKAGEDIRLVMVRRMIALIREHYQGDFDWVSHRLNRTMTLSARPADTAFLEDFLMKEFFGANYKTQDGLRY